MNLSFNKWLESLGYRSYTHFRNSMMDQGFNVMFVNAAWKDIEKRYNDIRLNN